MNSEKSRTSEYHVLVLNAALSNLSIYSSWKNIKKLIH